MPTHNAINQDSVYRNPVLSGEWGRGEVGRQGDKGDKGAGREGEGERGREGEGEKNYDQ
jgi:hypothetical protein